MSATKNGLLSGLLLVVVGWAGNGCNEAATAHVDSQNGGAGGGSASGGTTATGGGGAPVADGRTGTGGGAGDGSGGVVGIATGGQTSGGATGSTAVGGSAGSGGNVADASPEAVVYRDASVDHLPIPDLGSRADTPPTFWTESFTPNCSPPAIGGRLESDGHHRAGEDCMRSGCHLNPKQAEHHAGTDCRGSGCHANGSPDGSGAPAFLFGGTVYRAATLAADSGVQVGVKAAQGFYSSCSASNGNFWYVASGGITALTWTSASVRLRNANGEAPMMSAPAAGCSASTCHTRTLKMTSP
jgi:hypothetical protein